MITRKDFPATHSAPRSTLLDAQPRSSISRCSIRCRLSDARSSCSRPARSAARSASAPHSWRSKGGRCWMISEIAVRADRCARPRVTTGGPLSRWSDRGWARGSGSSGSRPGSGLAAGPRRASGPRPRSRLVVWASCDRAPGTGAVQPRNHYVNRSSRVTSARAAIRGPCRPGYVAPGIPTPECKTCHAHSRRPGHRIRRCATSAPLQLGRSAAAGLGAQGRRLGPDRRLPGGVCQPQTSTGISCTRSSR